MNGRVEGGPSRQVSVFLLQRVSEYRISPSPSQRRLRWRHVHWVCRFKALLHSNLVPGRSHRTTDLPERGTLDEPYRLEERGRGISSTGFKGRGEREHNGNGYPFSLHKFCMSLCQILCQNSNIYSPPPPSRYFSSVSGELGTGVHSSQ